MSVSKLIQGIEGNYLLVALDFYDDSYKTDVLGLPSDFAEIDVVDVEIRKLDLTKPLGARALFEMSSWLLSEFENRKNAIFTYICSTDNLEMRRLDLQPQMYRWNLFDSLFSRTLSARSDLDLGYIDSVIGPEGFRTYARAIYHAHQAPLVHLIAYNLKSKLDE